MTRANDTISSCGCGTGESRKATAVDPAIKERNQKRLRRIEGQVRGLQKMVDEERYCADILVQISSVQEALRSVGRELLRNHLKHCATTAIRSSDADAERMYEELVEMMRIGG
jgi:DNA-binding FrmR family transcriptional regulator